MNATRSSDAGFSLIEVMCAILVLGVGVAGLTEGITGALRSTRDAQLQTAAILFAQGQMELLRAEGFLSEGSSDGECGAVLAGYRWHRTIATTDLEGLYDVAVAIEEQKTGKSICELKTLVFEAPGTSLTPDRETTPSRDRDIQRRRRERGGGRG